MASGTSMATPHVAAAAAILAQAHPGWDGERLKTALTSTAQPIAASIYGQGAGRLDVTRAIAQPVYVAAGNLGFGFLTWPNEQAAMARAVTLHNDGDAAVVLDLALRITDERGNPAPAGMFTLDTSRVSLPPGERRDVTVTMQPLARTAGLYGGWLEASNESVRVVAAIGAEQEPERYELRLRQTWRTGKPAIDAFAYVVETVTGDLQLIETFGATGIVTLRMPPGTYTVIARLGDEPDEDGTLTQQAILIESEIALAADTSIELDAARALPLTVSVDRPGAKVIDPLLWMSMRGSAYGIGFLLPVLQEAYLTPTRPVVSHELTAVTAFTVFPADSETGAPYRYDLTFQSEGSIPSTAYRVRDRELARVDAHYHTQGVPLEALRVNWTDVDGLGGFLSERLRTVALPWRRTEYFSPGFSRRSILSLQAPGATGGDEVKVTHRHDAGTYALAWNAAPIGPGFGDPMQFEGITFWSDILIVNPGLFSPGGGGQDALTYSADGLTGSLTAWRDGEEVGHHENPGFVGFAVPPGRARYAIEVDAQRRVAWSTLESDVHVRWELTTEPPGGGIPVGLPIMVVRATGPVDESSVAPAGVPYALRLEVDHQVGSSPVTDLRLDVSYDEGATWRRAPVVRIGNQGFALLVHPRRAGTVSLRARASDAAGATVEHTTIQSYRIAP
jgi:hypothetical protein